MSCAKRRKALLLSDHVDTNTAQVLVTTTVHDSDCDLEVTAGLMCDSYSLVPRPFQLDR